MICPNYTLAAVVAINANKKSAKVLQLFVKILYNDNFAPENMLHFSIGQTCGGLGEEKTDFLGTEKRWDFIIPIYIYIHIYRYTNLHLYL